MTRCEHPGSLVAALGALTTVFVGGACLAQASAPTCSAAPGAHNHIYYADPTTLPMALEVATGGDVVYLSSGFYGAVDVQRLNSDYVTIAAANGQTPVFSSLRISGSHWIARGLTVMGLAPAGAGLWGQWPAHPALVQLGVGDNFILQNNTIASLPGQFPWAELKAGVVGPNPLSDGISVENSSCVTIIGNNINNIFNGIEVSGDQVSNHGKYYSIIANSIDNFAGDGIDHSISYAAIQKNIITNGHDICGNLCVHNDGIQGWNYDDEAGIINTNILIDSNMIILSTVPQLPLPADQLQGITIFDGSWEHVRVINNVVITDAWNGIAVMGANGLEIINNTVVGTSDRETWITAGGPSNEGDRSSDVTVRNNIASAVVIAKAQTPLTNVAFDFNIMAPNPTRIFVQFDVANQQYNLRPSPGSPAIGAGFVTLAPPYDITGAARTDPISMGAYQ